MGPVIVLGPPGSGDGVVVDALAAARELRLAPRTTPPFPEALTGVRHSHRLTARDARRVARKARAAIGEDGLLSGLRLALRVPFLDSVFPDARFVLVYRDGPAMLGAALDAWRSGSAISAPDLPDWPGPAWSLPLTDGWRELAGLDLPEIVARQWEQIATTLLDDLDVLAPERWCAVDRAALLDDPPGELRRLCQFLEIRYDQALATPAEAARRRRATSEGPQEVSMPEEALALAQPAIDRLGDVVAQLPPARRRWSARAPLASRSSRSFAAVLERAGVALVATSTQAGKVITVRQRDGRVNTDFLDVERPRDVAATAEGITLMAGRELWEFRADGPTYALRTRHLDADLPAPASHQAWSVSDEDGTLLRGEEVVAELPGAASALALAEGLAFVALSQRRGADLPVARRLAERRCGIWVVDLGSGAVVAFLEFTEAVHELSGLALLPHPWPQIVLRR